MDKYEKEIFDFLTQKENFEAMLKVNNHLGMVRENLLQTFWDQVALKLELETKQLSDKWKVFNPERKERNDAKLIIYKDNWRQNENHPFVGVAWEHLFGNAYYGVWSNMKSTAVDSQKLKSALDILRVRLNFRVDTNWWPLWEHGNYNFSVYSNISNILPDRLENSVEEYSYNLLNLLLEVEKIIDEVIGQP